LKKKKILILICLIFISTVIHSIGAIPSNNSKSLRNENVVFKKCYIEANGLVDDMPQSNRPLMIKIFFIRSFINDRAFALFLQIIFEEPDVDVTIYSEKDGLVLWNNENASGVWGLRLIRFNGYYTDFTDENGFHVNLHGNAFRAIAATDE
jgi:hypothetical protein